MPSPFPGMDPYLENPRFWSDVHQRLASEISDRLLPRLRPKYVARLIPRQVLDRPDEEELRVIFPDVAIRQLSSERAEPPVAGIGAGVVIAPAPMKAVNIMRVPFRQVTVEIRSVGTGLLVAAIEILSPVNKRLDGEGREAYLCKRDTLLGSSVHLLEIDLLRRGERLPVEPPIPASADYAVVLSRADARLDAEVWPIALADPLPVVPLPLLPPDPDVALDLQAVIESIYERAGYDLDVDYSVPPWPPLNPTQSVWAERVLRR
ncbi:MAG: DUF4058 family protein [Caldilineaceae bacterium]|nr:DUF4058 family protein [Caldilineaceae bacterium]